MDKFLINGPCRVKGKVSISGSKNASLPILAATLLFDKPVIIKNLPRVRDIKTMLSLLKSLGSRIILSKDKKTVKIINKKKMKTFASYSLVKTMRGSILVLGPLISKFKKSKTSLPGGCLIGARPVNYHLSALKKLGMDYKINYIPLTGGTWKNYSPGYIFYAMIFKNKIYSKPTRPPACPCDGRRYGGPAPIVNRLTTLTSRILQ